MVQVLHDSARTTEAVRRAIQNKSSEHKKPGTAVWGQPQNDRQVEKTR